MLQVVAHDSVAALWPEVAPWLVSSIAASDGEYALDDLRSVVMSGEGMLVVRREGGKLLGAAVVEIHLTPRHRILHVLALGGRGVCTQQTYDALREIGRTLQCQKVQCWAKPAQARLYQRFGMEPRYFIMRDDI